MKSLIITLSDDLAERLKELSSREHRSPEATACEILRRRLILDRFHDLCKTSETLAKAAGFETEEDILRAVS